MTSPAINAREIAAGLTKASRKALPRLGEAWISGEAPSVRDGVYSLGWGKDAQDRLIEMRWTQQGELEVRLTRRGLEVRAILQSESGNG
jgi:hypothetical protein